MCIKKYLIIACQVMLLSSNAFALSYNLPSNGDNVVGSIQEVKARPGERLSDVGRRYDIGYYEMIEANPGIHPDHPLSAWASVKIPSRFVLPPGPKQGIVINLAELRLYYYPEGTQQVITEPVGIGRVGWNTPLGKTKIVSKVKDPAWHPSKRVREDAEKQGYILPKVWPAGPDNPLGQYMMRLGWTTYLIHGTNRPDGVGKRSSAGCIRMFPEDIESLFSKVPVGTTVRVINRPIKVGWQNGLFYLEAHKPLEEKGKFVTEDHIGMVGRIHEATKDRQALIRWREAKKEVARQTGIPRVIGSSKRLVFND